MINVRWLEADDGAYTDVTNCMMPAALPGQVGDGEGRITLTNTDAKGTAKQVQTYVGARLGDSKLRRFLVGPKQCEITGITRNDGGMVGSAAVLAWRCWGMSEGRRFGVTRQ